jgi:hypothetical protein
MSLTAYLPSFLSPAPPPSLLSQLYTSVVSNPITYITGAATTTMSTLLPLPFLSLLMFPLFTSYSTTLNVLFFYLMWSTLVLSHPPLRLEIFGTLLIRIVFYLVPSTTFLLFDTTFPKAAISLKAQEETGLPSPVLGEKPLFKKLSIKMRPKEKWYKVYGWSLLNLLLSVALQGGIDYLFTKVLRMRSALKVTTTLPMPWGIAKDLVRGFLLREILTYVLHRYVLHSQSSPLSSYHKTWSHSPSLPAPYSLSAHYDHPLAYLIRSFLPTYLPALLFRFHLLSYLLYLILVSLEETFAYSGYSTVPTNFILGGIARRTDTHFLCKGEGNYAPFGIMDWAMGTSVGDDILEDVEREADKHDVNGKVNDAVDGVKKKGRELRARGGRKSVRRRDD